MLESNHNRGDQGTDESLSNTSLLSLGLTGIMIDRML
jgi:hypothetical protein